LNINKYRTYFVKSLVVNLIAPKAILTRYHPSGFNIVLVHVFIIRSIEQIALSFESIQLFTFLLIRALPIGKLHDSFGAIHVLRYPRDHFLSTSKHWSELLLDISFVQPTMTESV